MKRHTLLVLTITVFFAVSRDPVHAQFIISEFMANNVSSVDVDEDTQHEDWIEIQNVSTSTASLNGWYLTDDATKLRKWQFPVTTPAIALAAGARLTVWASDKNRKAVATKLHSNFKLSADGEFLGLVRPDGATIEHSYGPAYPAQFPNGTYGTIPSTETIVAVSETGPGKARVPVSLQDFTTNFAGWNSSPTFNETGWQSGNSGFGFGSTAGTHIGSGGNVASLMSGINSSCFVRFTFNLPSAATVNAVRMRLRYDDGYVAFLNGTQIASGNSPASLAWNSAALGARNDTLSNTAATTTLANAPAALVPNVNVLAFQMMTASTASTNALLKAQLEIDAVTGLTSGYLTSSTRNLTNSAIKTAVGPAIVSVTDKPAQPTGGPGSANLAITAKVTPTLRPLATTNPVTLKWRIMHGDETAIVMTKISADTYSASIPTTAMAAGEMIRWRIEAKDNSASPVYSYAPAYGFDALTPPANPPPVDASTVEANGEQYYGTVAVPVLVGGTQLPVLHWFFTGTDNTVNATGTHGSLFWQPLPLDNPPLGYTPPKPRFYDNVLANIHGQTSSGFPKKSHDLSFSKDNKFLWKDGEPETSGTNLLTNFADKSKVRNPTAWWAWDKSGHLASHYDVTIRVQQNNAFKGIYDLVENANASWLKREGLDEAGALYKVYNNLDGSNITTNNSGVEKKNPDDNNSTDLAELVAGISDANAMTDRLKHVYDNVDIASTINMAAMHSIILNRDWGHKNYYIYRDTHGTMEWSLLPWDQDLSLGHTYNNTAGYYDDDIHSQGPIQTGATTNRLLQILYGTPELNSMFVRRVRTLAEQFYVSATATDGPFEQHINEILNMIDPSPENPAGGTDDADLDMRQWGFWTDGSATVRTYTNAAVLNHTVRAQALRITTANDTNIYPGANPYAPWGDNSTSLLPFIPGRRAFYFNATPPTSGSLALPSSQPLAPPLSIEQINFNPGAATQSQEYFVIRNPNNYAVDLSGWKLGGDISMIFRGGTVIPAQGTATTQAANAAYVNQLVVANNPAGFRTRTTTPKSNEYRQVSGPYEHQLSARGGSITLSRPNDLMNPSAGYTLVTSQSFTGVPTEHQTYLRISEINFRPAPAVASELTKLPGLVAGDFEFLELINNGPATLPLGGAFFDKGIEFTFPPGYNLASGQRCLVVASQAAFEARYGLGYPIAGEFTGSLDNSGETLRLLDPAGEEVLDFTYSGDWFPLPAGQYRSLVTRQSSPAFEAYFSPATWALSEEANGSPNAQEATFSKVYESWIYTHFASEEIPTTASPDLPAAMLQDPDKDGMNNLWEYAFATNPKSANGPTFSSGITTLGADSYLSITFNRPKNALDLSYVTEVCSDLAEGTWMPVNLQVGTALDSGDGTEQVTYRDLEPLSAGGHRFIRARATK